jgi:hypothetical protein
VIIAFKNFRKTLKNEAINGAPHGNVTAKGAEAYRVSHLNGLLHLPNCDLTSEDIEKPENITKAEVLND